MKLNLTIDVDWLQEDMSLDDAVKEEVKNSIVEKIKSKVEKQIEKEIESEIDGVVVNKINEMTTNVFNDFINRPITMYDEYGDKIESYDRLSDLIKERFDNFINQPVDKEGKTSTSSYNSHYTRLSYIIDKQLKEYAKDFTDNAVKQVSQEIRDHVKEGLTDKLGKELMKVLKVEEMLELKSNNRR